MPRGDNTVGLTLIEHLAPLRTQECHDTHLVGHDTVDQLTPYSSFERRVSRYTPTNHPTKGNETHDV